MPRGIAKNQSKSLNRRSLYKTYNVLKRTLHWLNESGNSYWESKRIKRNWKVELLRKKLKK